MVAALASALVLAACGGADGGESAGDAESPAANPPAEAPPAADGASVTADLAEFSIALSETALEPGSYTFVVENSGSVDHALEVEGPSGEVGIELIAPGDSAELAVTLEDGAYELYCPVPGHREQGMELDLVVGTGGGAATTEEPPATTAGGGGYKY
jgi:uncharacterized cupredoxin-like copper-binding protein